MSYTSNGFTADEVGFIQIAHTKVLAAAARGELDLNLLGREELASRGLDKNGTWVGFKEAEKIHQTQDRFAANQINTILALIARNQLGIETLETRHSDSPDFYDIGVERLKAALQAAFMAGCELGIQMPKPGESDIAAQP